MWTTAIRDFLFGFMKSTTSESDLSDLLANFSTPLATLALFLGVQDACAAALPRLRCTSLSGGEPRASAPGDKPTLGVLVAVDEPASGGVNVRTAFNKLLSLLAARAQKSASNRALMFSGTLGGTSAPAGGMVE